MNCKCWEDGGIGLVVRRMLTKESAARIRLQAQVDQMTKQIEALNKRISDNSEKQRSRSNDL